MSALTPLKPHERQTLELAERPRERGGSFHKEIQRARRAEPAKRHDDPAAPPPQAPPPTPDQAPTPVAPNELVVAGTGSVENAVDAAAKAALETVAQAAAAEPLAAAGTAETAVPLTPLEQAVHDLIEEVRGRTESPARRDEAEPVVPAMTPAAATVPLDDKEPAPVAAAAPVTAPDPEQVAPQAQSHVHLVLDEGERLVVTVAVRGDNVVAHVRGGDDSTAAAIARNAATLDHAMRARGLNLAELHTTRDHDQRERPEHQRRDREPDQPKFTLEDTP